MTCETLQNVQCSTSQHSDWLWLFSLLFQTTPTRPQAITFSRLPDERQKLLNQRKKEMLEHARRLAITTLTILSLASLFREKGAFYLQQTWTLINFWFCFPFVSGALETTRLRIPVICRGLPDSYTEALLPLPPTPHPDPFPDISVVVKN